MSEPYYIITKLTESAKTSSTGAIPESELKRRLEAICKIYHIQGGWSMDVVVYILLKGTTDGTKNE